VYSSMLHIGSLQKESISLTVKVSSIDPAV
jgi:hypothetical protein